MLLTEYLELSKEARSVLTRTELLDLLEHNNDTLMLLTKFEEFKLRIDAMIGEIKSTSETVLKQNTEIQFLRASNDQLKSEVRQVQQYSRVSNIQINGLKLTDFKQCEQEVINYIDKTFQTQVTPAEIDACHTVQTRRNQEIRPIIVRFVSRKTKEKVIAAAKRNRTNNGVYFNDHLTRYNQFLFKSCIKLKIAKGGSFKYLWTRNGNIYLRKEDGGTVIPISSEKDLEKVGIHGAIFDD